MKNLTQNETSDKSIPTIFEKPLKRFGVAKLLRSCNILKLQGFSAFYLFSLLLGLVFSGKKLGTILEHDPQKIDCKSDTIYRFLNSAKSNWERLVATIAIRIIKFLGKLTEPNRKHAIIIDDSPYYKDRAKHIELLGKCYDHVKNKFYKGFTFLAIAWTDGVTLVPLFSRLLTGSKNNNVLKKTSSDLDKRTLAYKRRQSALHGKPTAALDFLSSLKGSLAKTKYVLFDCWYATPSFFLGLSQLGYYGVGRLKKTEKQRFIWNGNKCTIRQIYNANKKRPGRAKYLLSVIVKVFIKDSNDTIDAKCVFIRNRNNKNDWLAILCADVNLSEEEIIQLYAKRWQIEDFFKTVKQDLKLGKEFHGRSYDALTAQASICLIRYQFMALEHRETVDSRSISKLFHCMCKEMEDISLSYALNLLLRLLDENLKNYDIVNTDELLYDVFNAFLSRLSMNSKAYIVFRGCGT